MKYMKNFFQKIIKDITSLQFYKFLIAGVISTLLAFISRFIFQLLFSYTVSVSLSSVVGIASSFLISKFFVFDAKDEHILAQSGKYLIASMFSIILVTAISSFIVHMYSLFKIVFITVSQIQTLAHVVALGANTLYGFFIKKYFVFKKFNFTQNLTLKKN